MLAEAIDVPALPSTVPGAPSTSEGQLSLDLAAAFQLALTRNLELVVGRYNLASADANIHANTGIFDLGLGFGVGGDYTESPAATALEGAEITESRDTRFGLRIDQLLPTGTQLQFDAGAIRSATNSRFFFVNPRWNMDASILLRQPLLRGFGTLVNRAGIVIARNNRARTAEAFEIAVVGTLQVVENSYWDLVATRRAVSVSEQSLELAERLLRETDERVKVGTSAPIDLVQSESGVATRRQNLIAARNLAANAEDGLKAVLGFDAPEEWLTGIETTETYEFQPIETDLREAIDTALERRPEIREKRLEIEQLDYNVKLARNNVLPNLDLEAGYGFGGIGGDIYIREDDAGIPIDPPIIIPGGPGDAWKQVRNGDFPNWRLGAQFSIPLGNNEAQGRLAQRRFLHERGLVELAALRQQIIREVRISVRALEDGAAQVEASLAARDLAERNLEAEETKFENGLSTNYQVLEIQEDLAQAQLSLIRAYLDYRKALVGYRYATGTLLDFVGVDIVDPGSPDIPHDYWKDVEWLQFSDFKGSAARVDYPSEPIGQE
jgi:HAE1 family hydrophobic/amphiphilic exporter-1